MSRFFCLFLIIANLQLVGQENYKKLSINDAIAFGLKNNQEIIKAKHFISSAKGKFWYGISLPQPEVRLTYEYVPLHNSLSMFGERTFEISQSFEFPSNYFLKAGKLNKEEEIANLKLFETELAVKSDIKAAYYKVLAIQKLLILSEENVSVAGDFYKKAEVRYNVGEGTNVERLTAKVQFSEAINKREASKNDLKNAYAEFNSVMGYGEQGDENYILTDSLYFKNDFLNQLLFEDLYKISFMKNPDILIANLNTKISSLDHSLAWTSLLPNFNLGYYRQSTDKVNGLYGASFGMTVPLWFLFENRGRIREAAANVDITESEFQLTKNNLNLKLKNAFLNYQNNLKQVRFYINEILPEADEIYRAASAGYEVGEITYLEFLQARHTFINAERNYINVLYDYNLSLLQIEKITGQDITENLNGVK